MDKVRKVVNLHPKTVTEYKSHEKRKPRAKGKRNPVVDKSVDKRVWKKAMELAEGDATRIVNRKRDSVVVVNQSKRKN